MPEYIPSTITAALFPLQSDMIAKVTAKGQALQYSLGQNKNQLYNQPNGI